MSDTDYSGLDDQLWKLLVRNVLTYQVSAERIVQEADESHERKHDKDRKKTHKDTLECLFLLFSIVLAANVLDQFVEEVDDCDSHQKRDD